MSFVELCRGLSSPLEPIATDLEPQLEPLEGIRAVLFDVYGTLLVSASGDISLAEGGGRGDAVEQVFASNGIVLSVAGSHVVESLHAVIGRHHQQSSAEFAEVEIREVWRDTLDLLADEKSIKLPNNQIDVEQLAIEYEMRVNPVWPMPSAGEAVAAVEQAGVALGIVSNAQFFTPLLFPALVGGSLEELGFDENLQFWSYAHRQAKPGVFLYERAAAALESRDISPAESLYVGNDMRNDVAPAARVGFRTVLFAGDQRSLRLREADPMVDGITPDRIVTELQQLPEMLLLR